MTLKTELKITLALAVLALTMLFSSYVTYRVDRHLITTQRRELRDLRAIAGDYDDIMMVAGNLSKNVHP